MIDMEDGDIVVVLQNDVSARTPNGKRRITPGEKIRIHSTSSKSVVAYNVEVGDKYPLPNCIPIRCVEKIYYNDAFRTAWALFGGR